MNLVFFDFDNTLTKIDTTLPLAAFIAHKKKKRVRLLLLFMVLLLCKLRLVSNTGMKKIFLHFFIRDEDAESVRNLTKAFVADYLDILANKEIVDRLRKHVAKRDEVYLVSANFDFFLLSLRDQWNLAGVIATRTELKGSAYSGAIVGESCFGPEKLSRAVSLFGRKKIEEAIAYGDSEDDLYLLNARGYQKIRR